MRPGPEQLPTTQIVWLNHAARGPEATNNFLSASNQKSREAQAFSLNNLAES
jgi:hypothetical protein